MTNAKNVKILIQIQCTMGTKDADAKVPISCTSKNVSRVIKSIQTQLLVWLILVNASMDIKRTAKGCAYCAVLLSHYPKGMIMKGASACQDWC